MNRAFLQSIFLLALGGCHGASLENACQWLGACDQAGPPAERIVILCDSSAGSSCSRPALDSTTAIALRHIIERPDSRIEIWTLGSDVASTQVAASFAITRSRRNGVRATLAHRDRQIDAASSLLSQESDEYLRSQPPSRSPLLAAFAKVSLSIADSGPWHVIAVTDALEYSSGLDFECAPPKDTALFRQAIQNAEILTPGSLSGATITFAFVTLGGIDGNRCAVEIGRARKIRELWTSVLTAAGARLVTFESGPPRLEALGSFHDPIEQGERP